MIYFVRIIKWSVIAFLGHLCRPMRTGILLSSKQIIVFNLKYSRLRLVWHKKSLILKCKINILANENKTCKGLKRQWKWPTVQLNETKIWQTERVFLLKLYEGEKCMRSVAKKIIFLGLFGKNWKEWVIDFENN